MNSNTTVTKYVASYPLAVQRILRKIKSVIKKVVPKAVLVIKYGIPTFVLDGKNLIHYAAYKTHIGLYPGPKAIRAFKDDLKRYKLAKGTIRFDIDEDIPYALIGRIAKHLVKQRSL